MQTDIQAHDHTAALWPKQIDITPNLKAVSPAGIPSGHVLVLGLLPLKEGVLEGVRTGNVDLMMQGIPFDEFLKTIRVLVAESSADTTTLPGATWNSLPHAAAIATAETVPGAALTSRERQVMGLIGDGMSNKEIAVRLNVAVHTVKTHVHKVLQKLAVRTRLEVAAMLHVARTSQARGQLSQVA